MEPRFQVGDTVTVTTTNFTLLRTWNIGRFTGITSRITEVRASASEVSYRLQDGDVYNFPEEALISGAPVPEYPLPRFRPGQTVILSADDETLASHGIEETEVGREIYEVLEVNGGPAEFSGYYSYILDDDYSYSYPEEVLEPYVAPAPKLPLFNKEDLVRINPTANFNTLMGHSLIRTAKELAMEETELIIWQVNGYASPFTYYLLDQSSDEGWTIPEHFIIPFDSPIRVPPNTLISSSKGLW